MWSFTDAESVAAAQVDSRWGQLLADVDLDAPAREAAGAPVPEEFLAAAAEQGLQALPLPEAVGGENVDPATWMLILERIGYLCRDFGFSLILGIRAVIAQALLELDRPDLTDRYVVPIARGSLGAALAYSEDADAFSFETTVTRSGGRIVLSGHKDFVTGGRQADAFLTYARDEASRDMVACMVHRDDPGVEVIPLEPVGTRTSGPAALELRDVALPADRILVTTDGLSHAQRLLNARRLTVCGAPIGRARALVELSAAGLEATTRHGQKLSDLPNVQGALGRMYIAVEAARAMLSRAAQRVGDGEEDALFDPVVSAAKHFTVECVRSVVEEALQVLGGKFYYGDPYFGACMRDFAGLVAVAGTQDLLEINLGSLARAHLASGAAPRPDPIHRKEGVPS